MATGSVSGVGTATLSDFSSVEDKTIHEVRMLDRALPNFLHIYFGMLGAVKGWQAIPEHEGTTVQWTKLSALTAVTTALNEHIVPEPQDITLTYVNAQVSAYGAYIKVSKTLVEFGIHRVMDEASDALGEQAGDSLDLLTRAVTAAATTVQWANGRANDAAVVAGDYLDMTEIAKAVTTLRTNKARGPMGNGNYPALLHPKAVYDMFQDATFQQILAYSQERGTNNPWFTGHVGTAFGVDFWMTPNAYSVASTVTLYHTLLIGRGAFGTGGLAAYMPSIANEDPNSGNHTFEKVRPLRLITQDFGSAGTDDPFMRIATIAWYTTFVAVILDQNFMVSIHHDCSLD